MKIKPTFHLIKVRMLIAILLALKIVVMPQTSTTIVDSLRNELKVAKTAEDSVTAICWLIWSNDNNDSLLIAQYEMEILELSKKIENAKMISELYDAAGKANMILRNIEKAELLYKKSLEVGEKNSLPNRVAWAKFNLAVISIWKRDFKEAGVFAADSRKLFLETDDLNMALANDRMLIESGFPEYNDSLIVDYEYAISTTSNDDQLLNYYFYLSYLYDEKENKKQSLLFTVKMLEIAERLQSNKEIVNASYIIADYLRDYQKNYVVALLYYNKIYEILKAEKNEVAIAGLLEQIGYTHKLAGNDSLAMNYYNRALKLAKKNKHRHSIANAYKNIGEIFFSEKNYQEAINYYLKSYATGCDICEPIAFHELLVNAGNSYLQEKNYVLAIDYYSRSLKLADSSKANYEKAVSLLALADFNLIRNNTKVALNYYNRALKIADSASSLSLMKKISAKLSSLYRRENDYHQAYKYLELSREISDSLNRLSEVENLSRLETKFELQKIENQKKLELQENSLKAEARLNEQILQKQIYIVAFILMTGFGIFVFISLRRKKKDSIKLEKQKNEIEKMSQKVHQADQKRLNFFANISHEFRTPLTLILGPIERLIKENSNAVTSKTLLNIIHRNSIRLNNLITQLLEIRKLDVENVKLNVALRDFLKFYGVIYSSFSSLAEDKGIEYSLNIPDGQLICWFDGDILEKAINNLVLNAFKFTPRGGNIKLSAFVEDYRDQEISKVKIVVSDDGVGIPKDQLEYVYERYYQVENTEANSNIGTGIGLAYTKELIKLHKGEIFVESKINEGTKFSILLPVNSSSFAANEKNFEKGTNLSKTIIYKANENSSELINLEKNVEEITESSEQSGKIILLVEDNEDLREFIKNTFSDKYIFHEAADGESGLRKAIELIPDAIISDIMMPVMNGLEMCNKIKTNTKTSHIPILILTAKAGEENEIDGISAGADDYLCKPFNSDLLELRVARLVDRTKKLQEHFIREFLLNPQTVKPVLSVDKFLMKAIEFVEENITNSDLDVEMLMNELAMSRTQLFRKLKAVTSLSANQFIRNIRLKKAAELLQDEKNNVTDVVYLSGFNSPSYFTSCFKEMYGCMPKDYAATRSKK